MTTPFLVWGHEAAFLAYLVFAAIVAMRSSRTLHAALFLIVMLFTAAWAQSFVAVYLGYAPIWLEGVMAAVRDASWLGLSLALMQRNANHTGYFRVLTAVVAASSSVVRAASFSNACAADNSEVVPFAIPTLRPFKSCSVLICGGAIQTLLEACRAGRQ